MKSSSQSTPRYTVVRDGDEFQILHGRKPVATPMGNPLRTVFKDLAKEIAEDLERQGPDPTAGVSMYACLCSYLDFGPRVGKQGLIANILPALLEDPVLRTSADPEIMFTQMAAFAQPYFKENKVREKSPKDLMQWAAAEMASWSMQEVMVVQLAGAHIGSPLMGMALAQDKAKLETAAFGFCGKFWQHKMNSLGGICFGAFPEFYPNRADERFCDTVCLADQDEEKPAKKASLARFRQECGVVLVFDVWRRFAAYGRKQRIGFKQNPEDDRRRHNL